MRSALLVLALTATTAAATDYKIVRRTTVEGSSTTTQTEYWTAGRVIVDDPTQRTIVDFHAGTATVVDKDGRRFTKVRLDDLRRGLVAVGTMIEQLPPAAREYLGIGRNLGLAPTGEFTTIANRRAREYAIGGEGVTGWVWLAEDLDPRAILGDDASAWWRAGGPLRAVGPLGDVARAIEAGGVKGMPVWVWLTAGSARGTTTIASQVDSIDEARSPAEIERVPPGYREETPSTGD